MSVFKILFALGIVMISMSMNISASGNNPSTTNVDSVFELRQYTLHKGQRDTLISMFEKNFIEPQNAVGARIYGLFRDLDDPDRFVWIRGFSGMPERPQALGDFYGGPIWQSHRNDANKTMLDSDNVLLLRPIAPYPFLHPQVVASSSSGVVSVMIYYLGSVDAQEFAKFYNDAVMERLTDVHAHMLAQYITEEAPNNFPKLPVRDKERVFAWIGHWNKIEELDAFLDQFHTFDGWRDTAPETLYPAFMRKPEILRLKPTAASPLK